MHGTIRKNKTIPRRKHLKFSEMNTIMMERHIFLISVIGLFLFGCSSGDSGRSSGSDNDRAAEPVRVIEVGLGELARSITYTAHLQAFREVYLASSTPGRIHRILVEPGQQVRAGQVVVEMDQTQFHQAQLQLQSLETDYRRMDTLRKVGSISQQQYDQIRTQYDLAQSNLAFLEENTRLMAPFPGRVSGKYYENGEMFSGAPNTPVGKAAIVSLVQTSRMKAVVNVAERYYRYIQPDMEVKIHADNFPDTAFAGRVSTIYPVIDPITRTFKVEISIPNQQEKLRPGMFARASMDLQQVQAFMVPSLAVLKLQGSNERYVFLEENGRARRISVELGNRYDDMVELISDEINEGDRLIIAGQARLLDGVEVTVVQ